MTETAVHQAEATQLIDTYLALWRASDDATRRQLVSRVFVDDGRHVDPMADATGYDALIEMMANVHAAYPGFGINRTSGIDQHGDQLRFAWQLDGADGAPIVAGLDVAELARDGRLARVVGFWGELPAARPTPSTN